MNVIKMWQSVNKILNYINSLDFAYAEQRKVNTNLLVLSIQDMCKIGLSDMLYWENTEVNFLKLKKLGEMIQREEEAKDWVSISDILNYDLLWQIKYVAEAIFDKGSAELRDYFWHINKEALKTRYPELLKYIEAIRLGREKQGCRSYGIRGRVVYNTWEQGECDLYSGYNPIDMAMQTAEMLHLRKYNKIYIWGCNTGFEVNGIIQPTEESIDIEVYITDLIEFKQVLLNTSRAGILLCPSIKYNFMADLNDFIDHFDLQKKENSYIYVCMNSGDDLGILEQFIYNNYINSNIGEKE